MCFQLALMAEADNESSRQFTQSRKPFELHKSVQLVVLSHNAQAQASGLYLKAELDPEIDKLGGTFVSDEMRIR